MKMIFEEILQLQVQEEIWIMLCDLCWVFWCFFQMEFLWNYEWQMNFVFVYVLILVLKKFYLCREELVVVLKWYLVFFNIMLYIVILLLGIIMVMEEKNSQQKNMDVIVIDNVKVLLMGLLVGLGDFFFWGMLCFIVIGIGISLVLKGNIFGLILFLLVFNVLYILVCWCFICWGYVLGIGVLQWIQKSGMMVSLIYGVLIIGLMVVGVMIVLMIDIIIFFFFGVGEVKIQVQDIINDILFCMLLLVSFGIVYWLLGWKVKLFLIIGGMVLVGILGLWIGLF